MAKIAAPARGVWRRHYASPVEDGMWTWWPGPLAIETADLRRPGVRVRTLLVGALSFFVLGQPSFVGVQSSAVVTIVFVLLLVVEERIDTEDEACVLSW